MDRKVPHTITRRAFLGTTAKLAIGAAALLAGSTGLFYYGAVTHRKSPAAGPPPGNYARLGAAADLERLRGVTRVDYEAEYIDAWYTKPAKGFVYIAAGEDGKLLILSPACSHLGCSVVPATEAQRAGRPETYFWCPCHGAEFDAAGGATFAVERGLDTFEPVFLDGSVYIDIMKPIPGAGA
ncbi:Rieske 2Fe-2S domain-containing protein [Paenibacillus sp. MWE-103]|uniref:Rieske 2Fe-2S domain-containing protein n=1 Tax=Paenibacillus artemisiicola TaxID=1172618 RepID=A0ABS3W4R8_9BACL|nr:Rieske 2Fe-2S domain-containing protein [Paenibacillus artemisiicola]MBO7743297.1 Rieske 2Fe-2S domain-containing protein [Paenibacillus artemisiicola]